MSPIVLGGMTDDYTLKVKLSVLAKEIHAAGMDLNIGSIWKFIKMIQLSREFLVTNGSRKKALAERARLARNSYDRYVTLGIRFLIEDGITEWSQIESLINEKNQLTKISTDESETDSECPGKCEVEKVIEGLEDGLEALRSKYRDVKRELCEHLDLFVRYRTLDKIAGGLRSNLVRQVKKNARLKKENAELRKKLRRKEAEVAAKMAKSIRSITLDVLGEIFSR